MFFFLFMLKTKIKINHIVFKKIDLISFLRSIITHYSVIDATMSS